MHFLSSTHIQEITTWPMHTEIMSFLSMTNESLYKHCLRTFSNKLCAKHAQFLHAQMKINGV